jgi:hypothetical protein
VHSPALVRQQNYDYRKTYTSGCTESNRGTSNEDDQIFWQSGMTFIAVGTAACGRAKGPAVSGSFSPGQRLGWKNAAPAGRTMLRGEDARVPHQSAPSGAGVMDHFSMLGRPLYCHPGRPGNCRPT